jgi:polyferredoxin
MTPGTTTQRIRLLTQSGFFILFLLAPPLDLFRLDLTRGHFFLLGQQWTLEIAALQQGNAGAVEFAMQVLLYAMLPVLLFIAAFIFVAWRWGRLYCGWLCPHFSIVETVNKLMQRACGKPSLWLKRKLPEQQPDGSIVKPDARYWLPTLFAVFGFAFLWSVALLTYLLPPFEIYSNLLTASLTRNQALFIGIATLLFSIEFLFARHLFCRFGCAVGLFQSLAWMTNRRAMVVSFDLGRARTCQSCNNACDNVCPMRLKPRTIKRKMFACTECGQCISACTQVQGGEKELSLLQWVQGDEAEKLSETPMSFRSTAVQSSRVER